MIEDEESLRRAAQERLRKAVEAAKAGTDHKVARAAIRGASNTFFVELGEIARRFSRDSKGS